MSEETKFIVKVILAMLMFIIALSLSIYLFIKIKKNNQMTIVSKKFTLTGASVVNLYRCLIILGIILIAFFIIMLGMMVYNNVSNATNNAMYMSTSQYNTMRNMQYETYFGSKVTGTNVRALIQKVLTNNRQAVTNDEELGNMIYVRLDGKDITNYSDIKSGKNYSVNSSNNNKANDETKFGAEYWTNGFLKSIEITTLN